MFKSNASALKQLLIQSKRSIRLILNAAALTLAISDLHAQPAEQLRNLIPFPQQAIQVWDSDLRLSTGNPCEIVVGDNASDASLAIADSLLFLLRDGFGVRETQIARYSQHNENVARIFVFLEGEIQRWDEYREYLSNRLGNMTLREEGYFHLATDRIALIEGKDERGLYYGWQTMKALLFDDGDQTIVEIGVVINDYPTFPDRMLRTSSNFQVAANIPPLISLAQRAWNSRMNKITVNDVKFNRLDQVPDWYFDNVTAFRDELLRLNLEAVPGVADFGYSEGMLWDNPNLAEGVPVIGAKLVVEDGIGRLIPDPGMRLGNGGFEDVQNNRFAGFTSQENAGVSVFDDQQIVHSGSHSVRMENFRQGNNSGNCRFHMLLDCQPHRNYYFSIWVRTRNYEAGWGVQAIPYAWENGGLGQALAFPEFNVNGNTDWRKLEISFNSLDHRQIRLYFGVWGGNAGQVWFDDAELREIAFVNLLRREGCPLTISSSDGQTVYEEGEDFEALVDPRTGNVQWPGDFEIYHEPPELRITGNRIREGDTLLANFYHPILIYYGQVMCCPSADETYRWLEEDAERITRLWEPQSFFLNHDEIRVLNHDNSCRERDMTPAEILGSSVDRCTAIYRQQVESCGLYVWSDMFDPFHNAVDNYYLVNGSLVGAGERLPEGTRIVNWNYSRLEQSLEYFSSQGFPVLGSVDCSWNMNQARDWADGIKNSPTGRGMIYTTWSGRYDYIEPVGAYMWNTGPHIIHKLPAAPDLAIVALEAEIFVDEFPDNLNDHVTDALIMYKTDRDSTHWIEGLELDHIGNGVYQREIVNGAIGVMYYFQATDSRGVTRTSPPNAGNESYYLIGQPWDVGTEESPEAPTSFKIAAIQPNPFNNSTIIQFDMPKPGVASISITDLSGREVHRQSIDCSVGRISCRIDATGWSSGAYLLKLNSAQGEVTAGLTCIK